MLDPTTTTTVVPGSSSNNSRGSSSTRVRLQRFIAELKTTTPNEKKVRLVSFPPHLLPSSPPPHAVSHLAELIDDKYTEKDLTAIAAFVNRGTEWKLIDLLREFRRIVIFDTAARVVETAARMTTPPEIIQVVSYSSATDGFSTQCEATRFFENNLPAAYSVVIDTAISGAVATETDLRTACHVLRVTAAAVADDATQEQRIKAIIEQKYLISLPLVATLTSSWQQRLSSALLLGQHILRTTAAAAGAAAVETIHQSFEDLKQPPTLSNNQFYRFTLFPTSHVDAIVLAAQLYKINISKSPNPLLDFFKARSDFDLYCKTTFQPATIGSRFAQIYSLSPTQFNVESRWSLELAPYYSSSQAVVFASLEGFTSSSSAWIADDQDVTTVSAGAVVTTLSFATPEAALRYMEEVGGTVCFGKHFNATNLTSPISLDNIDELIREAGETSVLSFGIPAVDGGMVCISAADVGASFRATNAFAIVNPTTTQTKFLSKRIISKLERLARTVITSSTGSTDAYVSATYQNVLSEISRIRTKSLELSSHALELRKALTTAVDSDDANKCRQAYAKLLEAGMYMRGWKVVASSLTSYPLRAMNTVSEPSQQDQIDTNVNLALAEFSEIVKSVQTLEIRRLIRSSPLLKAVGTTAGGSSSGIRFAPMLNEEQGLTIEDRIGIISEGDISQNVFSCLRMSSNMIVATAYYFLVAVFQEDPPFPIHELDLIS